MPLIDIILIARQPIRHDMRIARAANKVYTRVKRRALFIVLFTYFLLLLMLLPLMLMPHVPPLFTLIADTPRHAFAFAADVSCALRHYFAAAAAAAAAMPLRRCCSLVTLLSLRLMRCHTLPRIRPSLCCYAADTTRQHARRHHAADVLYAMLFHYAAAAMP